MKNTAPLQPETFYHVYNRGINGENIFKKEDNYNHFLLKYDQYLNPVVDTYAYCFLKNHFHILIRTKSEEKIVKYHTAKSSNPIRHSASQIISLQFSHFFNGYTQVVNRQNERTGKLFELPFRRIPVEEDYYFSKLIHYIHANPQTHGLSDDFREWPYSSYHDHISKRATKLKRREVLNWFGDVKSYLDFHASMQDWREVGMLSFDD